MRKGDVVVGGEYAVEDRGLGWRPEAHRVAVVEVGPGAAVKVKVLDRAIGGDGRRWRRGRILEVTARELACTWEAWQERLAAREADAAADEERWREWEVERARAIEPDPARIIPDRDDREVLAEHQPYGQQLEAAVQVGGHRWRRVIPAALDLLPEAVQRDVVGAATADPGGRVAVAFGQRTPPRRPCPGRRHLRKGVLIERSTSKDQEAAAQSAEETDPQVLTISRGVGRGRQNGSRARMDVK